MKIYFPVYAKFSDHGGVTQYVDSFFGYLLSKNDVEIHDHTGIVSQRIIPRKQSIIGKIIKKIHILFSMVTFRMRVKGFDHVVLNPSLGRTSMRREMFYAKACLDKKIPYSIFFHGWDWAFCKEIGLNEPLLARYSSLMANSQAVFVLSPDFKDMLLKWGVPECKVHLSTTMVDDDFLPLKRNVVNDGAINILFLGRIVLDKGVIEAVQAFKIHHDLSPDSCFTIAGDGPDLEAVKSYVSRAGVSNVCFYGYANEEEKHELLSASSVLILPSYSEGMPISIFEAMAYGLSVVTRPVGGIPRFFVDGKMGFMIESLEPESYASALNYLYANPSFRESISKYNHLFVKGEATSSAVFNNIVNVLGFNFESKG